MEYKFHGKPDYTMVEILLNQDETILAESGAMAAMSPNIEIETKARGGFKKTLKRKFFSRESFFINTFKAKNTKGNIFLVPKPVGDMDILELHNDEFVLSAGAFVCSESSIDIDSKWGGFRNFFGGEWLFFLKVSGTGKIFFSSFGAIHSIEVDGEYIVDTGNIVGFSSGLSFNIEKVGGLKSLFLSGEGLVCRFTGKGKLLIQTRNENSFATWADQFRRKESNNNDD